MNPTPEVTVESDANRKHRHCHTEHIKSEQISLAKRHTDVQCQMVAASEYESPGVLCITRLTTYMKYVSAGLLGSLFANFDQFGTRGPTGPADVPTIIENFLSTSTATCNTAFQAYLVPLEKVPTIMAGSDRRRGTSQLVLTTRTVSLPTAACGGLAWKPALTFWGSLVPDLLESAFFHRALMRFLIGLCYHHPGMAVIVDVFELGSSGSAGKRFGTSPDVSALVFTGNNTEVEESRESTPPSILVCAFLNGADFYSQDSSEGNVFLPFGGTRWAAVRVSMFATPPAKYIEDSSRSLQGDKCLSHFAKANSRALKAWNEAIDGTPPANAITANRQGFWYCTMETVCQLETVHRQSGTKETHTEHPLVIKVANSKWMITLTTHMRVTTPEDAYQAQQTFEGFKVTDRFHLAASSGHTYDLAQLAFGPTHSKKAMATLAKTAGRLMPEGAAETAILTMYGVHVTDGDGNGITSILPLSSTVVHSTSIPR
jgi:hypothetical protein